MRLFEIVNSQNEILEIKIIHNIIIENSSYESYLSNNKNDFVLTNKYLIINH